MAEKHEYTVNRAMQDGATTYERGDTRKMTEIDAAPLLASGALSKVGEDAAEREPAVRHTFGTEPSEHNDRGYTDAGAASVRLRRAGQQTPKAAANATSAAD